MKLTKTLALVAAASLAAVAHAQYDFFVLHPTASQVFGAGPGQQVGQTDISPSRAAMWTGPASSLVDLHPAGFDASVAFSSDGTRQVGSATDSGFLSHAMMWASTNVGTDIGTTLFLAGYTNGTAAYGVSGSNMVGVALDGLFTSHAILWTSPVTYVDLTPAGYEAEARAIGGGMQAGDVFGPSTGYAPHAATWSGLSSTFTDLHPVTAVLSAATGTTGSQTVGYVDNGSGPLAALWNGISYVNLHPAGYTSSIANAVGGGRQVGTGVIGGVEHALAWSGTNVATDLHALTVGFVSSQATAIDPSGNISGTATDSFGTPYAVYWKKKIPHFTVFQNPVNDPASPESTFKRNSSVSLKIKLLDENNVEMTNEVVHLEVEAIGLCVVPVNVDATAQGYSTGNVFTYQGGAYSYLMSTKTLSAGVRYRITARWGTSDIAHSVTIGVR